MHFGKGLSNTESIMWQVGVTSTLSSSQEPLTAFSSSLKMYTQGMLSCIFLFAYFIPQRSFLRNRLIQKCIWGGGWDEMGYWDWPIYTTDTIYKRDNNNLFNRLYSTENATQCSAVTQIGRKLQKEGICVNAWLIHFAVQQKLTQHCIAIQLQ